jgi:succinylarginine dihydrolase
MPKKQVRTCADAPTTTAGLADALIAERQRGTSRPLPSGEALAELQKVLAWNDTHTAPTKKVSRAQAIEMLRKLGWTGESETSLDKVCREALGRRSYGTP